MSKGRDPQSDGQRLFDARVLPPAALMPTYLPMPPGAPEYPEKLNVFDELIGRACAEGCIDKPCVVFEETSWTYGQLQNACEHIAFELIERMGVHNGDRILVCGRNSPMWIACFLAILKIGGIAVPVASHASASEVVGMMEAAEARYALVDSALHARLGAALKETVASNGLLYFTTGGGDRNDFAQLDFSNFGNDRLIVSYPTRSTDLAVVCFTSGSTGRPKACLHFHRDLLVPADLFSRLVLGISANDKVCGAAPVQLGYGMANLILGVLRNRATLLLVDETRSQMMLAVAERHGATIFVGLPVTYLSLLPLLPHFSLPSLRRCLSGGEHLPRSLRDQWLDATGITIVDGLGMTEVVGIFVAAQPFESKGGTTGKVVPGYEAKVVDTAGKDVADGEVGELCFRGPIGCKYMNNPAAQAERVIDGWTLTGDLFSRDGEGYLSYHGRVDDVLSVGGFKMSPIEVEEALLEYPSVEQCLITTEADDHMGTALVCYVVLSKNEATTATTTADLRTFLSRRLATYKVPRKFEMVTELPRGGSGKLKRPRPTMV